MGASQFCKRFAGAVALVLGLAAAAPLAAQTAEEIIRNAPWTVYDVGQGVVMKKCHFDNLFGGQQDVYVTDADMTSPGVSLKFVSLADGTRRTVSTWAGGVTGAAAAINGAWFNPANGIPDQYLRIDGTQLALTNPVAQERGGIVISGVPLVTCRTKPAGGWASLPDPNIMASEVPSVVAGAPFTWTAVGAPDYNYYYVNRAPRTAIGVTADNHVLLVVVDGRRSPVAIGVSYAHVAELMMALGAVDATELDGGGSSTMWGRDYGVINQPSDGTQRTVASALCIVAPPVVKANNALFVSATYATAMLTGTTQTVTLRFQNIGTQAWDGMVRLGTTDPRDRASQFAAPSWIGTNRPCVAAQPSVAPGATGDFTFTLVAPPVAGAQTFIESFGLVREGVEWFGPELNKISVTVIPPGGLSVPDMVIESRTGGQNTGMYSESGVFADSGTACTAAGATVGLGCRYGSTYRSVAGLKTAIYRPAIPVSGTYEVFVAWGAGANRRSPITYKVTDATGITETQQDQSATANVWVSLGQHPFIAGTGGSVEMTNEDIDTGGNMFAGPVKFQFIAPAAVGEWMLH